MHYMYWYVIALSPWCCVYFDKGRLPQCRYFIALTVDISSMFSSLPCDCLHLALLDTNPIVRFFNLFFCPSFPCTYLSIARFSMCLLVANDTYVKHVCTVHTWNVCRVRASFAASSPTPRWSTTCLRAARFWRSCAVPVSARLVYVRSQCFEIQSGAVTATGT